MIPLGVMQQAAAGFSGYKLDDDGSIATAFGVASMPAAAPEYRSVNYTTTGSAAGGTAIAASIDPFGVGLIAASTGKVGFGLSISALSAINGASFALQAHQFSGGVTTRIIARIDRGASAYTYSLLSGTQSGGVTQDYAGAATGTDLLGVLLDWDALTISFYRQGALVGVASKALNAGEGWLPSLFCTDATPPGASVNYAGVVKLDAADLPTMGFPAGTKDYLENVIP